MCFKLLQIVTDIVFSQNALSVRIKTVSFQDVAFDVGLFSVFSELYLSIYYFDKDHFFSILAKWAISNATFFFFGQLCGNACAQSAPKWPEISFCYEIKDFSAHA